MDQKLAEALAVLRHFAVLTDEDLGVLADLSQLEIEDLMGFRNAVVSAVKGIDRNAPSLDDVERLAASAVVVKGIRAEIERRGSDEDRRKLAVTRLVDQLTADAAVEPPASTGRRLPSMASLARRAPSRTRPALRRSGSRQVLSASGEAVGDEGLVASMTSVVEREVRFAAQWPELPDRVTLATFRDSYPPERTLGEDFSSNQAKIDAVTSPGALMASGGVCAPVAVDYSLPTIAVSDRVVPSACAQFGAARGGVRYILPHTLAQVTTDGPAAVWTQATDALPGGSTKPHATYVCQAVKEDYVDAVTSIVQFGNFQARFFPEQITQYMDTVDAVHARLAESTLLSAISAGSTTTNADTYELGAARDFLATIDRAAAAYRYRHRMPDAPLRLIYPRYLNAMIRADLARQLPGDSDAGLERLATDGGAIGRWFSVRNINCSLVLDAKVGEATTGSSAGAFGTVQGNGQLAPWPLLTRCWLFHEGAWMFLDGGELNLGMVRDSTLNRTNDFQMFSETFEKVIFRGHESIELAMKIAPTGASAGTVATSTVETFGS